MSALPKLKPRRMWVDPELYALPGKDANVFSCEKCFPSDVPVAVIPLDDPEALIRIAGDAFHDSYDGHLCQSDIVAMLTAIGVLPSARKGRK